MAFLVNEHVERLWQYQPFHLNFSQLFAEFVDTRSSDQLATRALQFVGEAIGQAHARMVVLTGDPGHGKTHLCGQLLTLLEPGTEDVRKRLADLGDGALPVARSASGKAVHIIKDLSERTEDVAAQRLRSALSDPNRVTVVCANEGRLRHVIASEPVALEPLGEALKNVLATGRTTTGNGIWVVDLNHQSVAAPGRSLVAQGLRNWAMHQRKWNKCGECEAQGQCPIFENRRLLGADDAEGEARRAGLEMLLRIAEKTGHVVTIRELLALLAHAITGGLRCDDVHRHVRRGRTRWQWRHMYFQAVFGQVLDERDARRLAVFRATRLLDPGRVAVRTVDDELDMETSASRDTFLPPADTSVGPPRTRAQHRGAAATSRSLYEFLRRRSYFDPPPGASRAVSHSERLGFRYYAEFEMLLQPEAKPTETVEVRDVVLCGLEALQGVRRAPNQGNFAVVDPAFLSHVGTASVLAYQLPKKRVMLLSQSGWWRHSAPTPPDISSAVDWVDRKVHVVLPDARGKPHAVDLDCRQFELVCRAAHGLVSRAFFQADIRRVAGQLASVAVHAPKAEEITVIVSGTPARLMIDVGDVIVAGGD